MEKRELSYTVGGKVNWCIHHGKEYEGSLKKIKNKTTTQPSNPTPGHISGENRNTALEHPKSSHDKENHFFSLILNYTR